MHFHTAVTSFRAALHQASPAARPQPVLQAEIAAALARRGAGIQELPVTAQVTRGDANTAGKAAECSHGSVWTGVN